MAYPVGKAKVLHGNNANTYQVALPSHQNGDLLLLFLSQDGGGSSITESGTSNWTVVQPGSVTGAARQTLAYRYIASGAPVADPTFAGTASEAWSVQAIVIRDADSSTPVPIYASGSFTTNPAQSPALTTSSGDAGDGALILNAWCADGTTTYIRPLNNDLIELGKDVGDPAQVTDSTIASCVGYRYQSTAGAVSQIYAYTNATGEGGNCWTVAIKNKSGGNRPADCRTGVEEGIASTTGVNMYGEMGAANKSVTLQSPNTNFSASINGIATRAGTPSAGTGTTSANTGAEFWHGQYTYFIEGTNLVSEAWCGVSHTMTATDMTGKIFSLQWMVSGVFATYMGNEGFIVAFKDGSGNWAAFQVRDKTKLFQSKEISTQIDLENATTYDSSGTMDWSDVTAIGYFLHRLPGSGAQHSAYIKNAVLLSKAVITGGGSSVPASFTTLTDALDSWHFTKLGSKQASAQVMGGYDAQIGDGSAVTYFKASAQAFAYPLAYSRSVEPVQVDWNVGSQRTTVTVKASASDTMDFSAFSLVTTTRQSFTIDSASSTSATYSFAGASIVGPWDVTWKTGVPCTSCTFNGANSIDFKGADIVNVIVTDGVGTAACSASDGFSATGCTLTASSTAVYGIRIAAAGTFDLEDTTFSGFTKDMDVTATTGTVTINLAAGQATPTYQTSGATVTIVSDPVFQSVTVSGLVSGSRVQIYDTTSSTELYNDVPAGTSVTWTDSNPASASRAIRVRITKVSGATAKEMIEAAIGTCGTSAGSQSVSYLANQVDDDVYNTNAIDGSTVTDITIDDSIDRVKIDISGGAVTWPSIYAYQVYWLNTSTGIQDDFAFIEAPDTANYLLTGFDIRNTNSNPLTITGGWGRDSSTLTVAGCIDSASSTGNIFAAPDHVVPYSTGSGLTAGQAAQLTAIESATGPSGSVNADIVSVAGVTVSGTGTQDNPWGPA